MEEDWCIPSEIEDCEPTAEELDSIYNLLERGGMIELKWKCPGKRRAPSPHQKKEEVKLTETPEQKAKLVKEKEFDFSDEVSLPQIRQKQQTPKTNAKKKTNFDVVINQMRKHGRLSTAGASASTNVTVVTPNQTNRS